MWQVMLILLDATFLFMQTNIVFKKSLKNHLMFWRVTVMYIVFNVKLPNPLMTYVVCYATF